MVLLLQAITAFNWLQDDAAVLAAGSALGILRIDGSLQDRLNYADETIGDMGLHAKKQKHQESALSADLIMFPSWHSVEALPVASLGVGNLGSTQPKLIWEGQQKTCITSLQLNPANKHIALTAGTDGRVFVTNLSRYTAVLASEQSYAVNGMYSAGDVVTDARFFPGNPSAALCATFSGVVSVFDVRARPDSVASCFNIESGGLTGAAFLDEFTVMTSYDNGSVAPLDVRMGRLCESTHDKFMSVASGVEADVSTGVCVTAGNVGVSVWRSKRWSDADQTLWSVSQRSHHRAKALQQPGKDNGVARAQSRPYHIRGAFSSVQPGVFLAGDSSGNIVVLDTKSRKHSVAAITMPRVSQATAQATTATADGPVLVATAKSLSQVQRSELLSTVPSTASLSHNARVQAASTAVKLHRRQQKAVAVKKQAAMNSAALAASRGAGGDGDSTHFGALLAEPSEQEAVYSSDGVTQNMWAALSPVLGNADGFAPNSLSVQRGVTTATPNTVIEVKTHVRRAPMQAVKVNGAHQGCGSPEQFPQPVSINTAAMPPPAAASIALPVRTEHPMGLPYSSFAASHEALHKPSWFFHTSDKELGENPVHNWNSLTNFQAGMIAGVSNNAALLALGSLADASSFAEHHDVGNEAHVEDDVGRAIQASARTPKSAHLLGSLTPHAKQLGRSATPKAGARTSTAMATAHATNAGIAHGSSGSKVGALLASGTADSCQLAAPSIVGLDDLFPHSGQLASASVFDRDDYRSVASSDGAAAQPQPSASLVSSGVAHPHEAAAVGSSATSMATCELQAHPRTAEGVHQSARGGGVVHHTSEHLSDVSDSSSDLPEANPRIERRRRRSSQQRDSSSDEYTASSSAHGDRGQKRRRQAASVAEDVGDMTLLPPDSIPSSAEKRPRRARRASTRSSPGR